MSSATVTAAMAQGSPEALGPPRSPKNIFTARSLSSSTDNAAAGGATGAVCSGDWTSCPSTLELAAGEAAHEVRLRSAASWSPAAVESLPPSASAAGDSRASGAAAAAPPSEPAGASVRRRLPDTSRGSLELVPPS
eukprot:2055392-Prymnesium_polylepis.1